MNVVSMPLGAHSGRIVSTTDRSNLRGDTEACTEAVNQIGPAMRAASLDARMTKPQLVVLSAHPDEPGDAPLCSSLSTLGYRVKVGSAAFEASARGEDSPAAIIIVALDAGAAENGLSQSAALDPAGSVPVLLCAPVEVVRHLAWARFHDFLALPFTLNELSERVRRLTQRPVGVPVTRRTDLLEVDRILIDLAGRDVFLRGRSVRLTRLEFDLLAFFVAHPRRVLRRSELLASVWGVADSFSRTVDIHLRRLRVKIGDEGTLIQTVRGVGYKLVANVRPVSAAPAT